MRQEGSEAHNLFYQRQYRVALRGGMVSGIALLLTTIPSLSFALRLYRFEITPEVSIEERYDSNIFLTPSGEQDDFITVGALNLKVAYPFNLTRGRRLVPSVTYVAQAAAFAKHSDQNFQDQGISGGLDLDLPLAIPDQRFTFNVSNRFRSLTEVPVSAAQSDIGPRARRDENLLRADAGYFLTRLDEIHLFYNRLDVDWKGTAAFLDRNENIIGLTYFHRMRPWLSGLIEYNYKFINFTNLGPGNPDFSSTGHIMALGIRADPGARLSGTFRAGIEFRSPKVGVDLTRPFAEGSLGYQMTRRLSTSLFLSRAIEASTNQNFPSIDTTIMTLGLAYQVTRKVSAFTQGTFEVDEFGTRVRSGEGVPERRSDRLYAVGMGGNYRFARWLTGSLSYLHQTKNSNLTRINFVENQVILHITACPSLLLEGLTSPIRCPTLPSP